jgi:hypothetical protein
MSCTSILNLIRSCDSSIGGIDKLYIIAFKDLELIDDKVYTEGSNGVVNDIGLVIGKSFVEVSLLKNTTGLKETLQKDKVRGVSFYTQELSIVLSDLTVENLEFINSILNQPIALILKMKTGTFLFVGFEGGLELRNLEYSTGIAEGDLNGFTLSFGGTSLVSARLVDSSIIPSLLSSTSGYYLIDIDGSYLVDIDGSFISYE